MYRGYPNKSPVNHKGPWDKQILQGPGQVQAKGECKKTQIVYTFEKLTRGSKLYAHDLKTVEAVAEQTSRKLRAESPSDSDIDVDLCTVAKLV